MVNGDVFVVQTSHRSAEPNSVAVAVGFKHRDQLISNKPAVFYTRPHCENYPVVLLRLDYFDRNLLDEVLRCAYDAVASGEVRAGRPRKAQRSPSRKKYVRRTR